MNNLKRVLKASAGTGKTYRLSLEFINALLQFKGYVNFDEILVLTFTKKATAEIRLRILKFLKILTYKDNDNAILQEKENLTKSLNEINPNVKIDEFILKKQYIEMMQNKNKIQIFTIDAFINSIFRSLIAPYKNIADYKIEENINEEYYSELFEELLKDQNFEILKSIFLQKRAKNLETYQEFIKKILNNKWFFNEITTDNQNYDEIEQTALSTYKKEVKELIKIMYKEISSKKKIKADFSSYLSTNLNQAFKSEYLISTDNFILANFEDYFYKNLINLDFLKYHSEEILKKGKIWDGRQFRKKQVKAELEAKMEKVLEALSSYLFIKKAIPEQNNIIKLAKKIINKYDKIKLRDRIFTFNDISNYTYQYLFGTNEESILNADSGQIINYFYEKLSYRIKVLLIDEFQDTSVIQWRILYPVIQELISMENRGVVVVGDEKQSIYNWRGGKRNLLLMLSQNLNFPEIVLDTSYRSNKTIIDFVNKLFKCETLSNQASVEYAYENVKTINKDHGYLEINFENLSQVNEAEARNKNKVFTEIADQIKDLYEEKRLALKTTAVFCRSNNELQLIANKLTDRNIDFLLESSASLFEYKAIKPFIYLMKFLVTDNFYELAKFLRSDFVLLPTNSFKMIFSNLKNIIDLKKKSTKEIVLKNDFYEINRKFSVIKKIEEIDSFYQNNSIEFLFKKIVEQFNVFDNFQTELDAKNIFKFQQIISEFTLEKHQFDLNLPGFLEFIQKKASTIKQEGLEEKNAIQLLTIHKSKGLEFETVFTVFDFIRPKPSSENFYINFSPDYLNIENFALSYNYNKIFEIALPNRLRNDFEENYYEILNIFYVALTRPKSNLFIYNLFEGKNKSVSDYYSHNKKKIHEKENTTNAYRAFFNALYKVASNYYKLKEIKPNKYQASVGELCGCKDLELEETQYSQNSSFKDYFNFIELEEYKENEIIEERDYNKIYLENRKQIKGTIAHYFLSFIEEFDIEIIEKAKLKTLNEYGNIIPPSEIKKIVSISKTIIKQRKDLFKKEFWPLIFNEYSIYDDKNNEFIIDRLLVNKDKKEILIVDYKTGDFSQEQLENYKNILENMKFVKENNFSINYEFVEIEI